MKYKNYRNSYTNDNRIYCKKDLYEMPFGEFIRRKKEVLSQFRVLGIPSEKELRGSENVVHVAAYTREDGTEVKAHYRSKPNGGGSVSSHPTEQKPQTENEENAKQSSPNGVATEVKQEEKKQENNQTEVPKDNNLDSETKKEKMMYPDEVAGVKRGEPKTFEQMMQQGVNPNYMSEEDENGDYSKNCQSCTVAAELVIRGYDVEAAPYSTPEAQELSQNGHTAYLDPETGEECVPDIIYTNEIDCYDYLEQNVKQGERYELSYNTPTESGDTNKDRENEDRGHSVLITRNNNGELLYYDPQGYKQFEGESAKNYISTWFQYEHTVVAPPRILRVDDKGLNPKYVNSVIRKRKKD